MKNFARYVARQALALFIGISLGAAGSAVALNDKVTVQEKASVGADMFVNADADAIKTPHAVVTITHRRNGKIIDRQVVRNVITTVGRDFIHTQSYGTSPAGNGLNYIALSNDALTETTASTTLSTEIAANGLTRAQATTITHTTGTAVTTLAKTFTATGSQSCQKAALFTAGAVGTMNHALAFTQRALLTNDTITITFTITVG